MNKLIISIITIMMIIPLSGHNRVYNHSHAHQHNHKHHRHWTKLLDIHLHYKSGYKSSRYWKQKYHNVREDFRILNNDYKNLYNDYQSLLNQYNSLRVRNTQMQLHMQITPDTPLQSIFNE